jgi:hypothetical protein
MLIDGRIGLLGLHFVAGRQDFEPLGPAAGQVLVQHRPDIGERGAAGDGEADAGGPGLVQKAHHAAAQRDLGLGQQAHIDRRLGTMQPMGQLDERCPGRHLRSRAARIVHDPLSAARDGQQTGVLRLRPHPGQSMRREGLVEGTAMDLLGVGDGSVEIEYKGPEGR